MINVKESAMANPETGRSGYGKGQETIQKPSVQQGPLLKPLVPESPAPATESPTKWVVFRSKDKELTLFQKAGYMDKSHGISTYTPSVGVQFADFVLRIQDSPEHEETIKWVRTHPSNGIAFMEVPDMSNAVELPTIEQLKQMTIDELKEICAKNKVTVNEDAGKATIILALLEGAK